jgi:hypothetical protein
MFIKRVERNPSNTSKEISNIGSLFIEGLTPLLKLATFLQASQFHDAIVDSVIEVMRDLRVDKPHKLMGFSEQTINNVFDVTTTQSTLRKLLVDGCLYAWGANTYRSRIGPRLNVEFLIDFIIAAEPYITSDMMASEMPDPIGMNHSCKYHEHTLRGEPCYKTEHQYLPKNAVITGIASTVLSSQT